MLDVLIIGGSNAGLSAALVLGRARRRVLVLDHGQPRNAPSAHVQGFFTRDGTPPAELRRIAHEQLRPYTTVTTKTDTALTAQRAEAGFVVTTHSGNTYHARMLLLATGVHDELLPIPGLAERWGRHVLHCPYCHGWEVRERRLAVLANAPWATEYALTIRGWSDAVTLLTNGPITLDANDRQRLVRHGVALDERPLAALSDDAEGLVRVQFTDGATDDYAALFHRPRQRQASDLAQQLGCALDVPFPGVELIQVDAMGQTSIPGVYAAGDATTLMQQAIVAASAGMIAASTINRALLLADFA
ncbi:MAG: NAD(P)/FAD-dependent oxidoreductase [Blastochloris sp.]|nr:NAD(P)/FAD-dependent oxidoreductase [Blastochloris sp.]